MDTRHKVQTTPTQFATLYAGWLASIETHPSRWQWPTSTGAYLRYRIGELTAEMLAAEVAVQS